MLTLSIEEKQFISRLEDRLERVEERYQEEITDFLEPRLQLVAEEYLRSKKSNGICFAAAMKLPNGNDWCCIRSIVSRPVIWQGLRFWSFRGGWILYP